MKTAIQIGALLIATSLAPLAHAQYKCTSNGKTTYSDVPCSNGGNFVGKMEDSINQQSRMEAEQLRRKEAMQRGAIEHRENTQIEANRRALQQQVAMEQAMARADERKRQDRCANLQQDINRNQRGVARYQDFGMQRSLTQQENELKRNREAYDRECR